MFRLSILILLCEWLHPLDSAASHYFHSYRTELQLNAHDISADAVSLISNDDIVIELVHDQFIINHRDVLSFDNDSAFDEIRVITSVPPPSTPSDDIPPYLLSSESDISAESESIITTNNAHQRRLLWNHWDHSTENHVKMGRFIGDPSKRRSFDDARSLCREYCM